jgi:hypothetical protein
MKAGADNGIAETHGTVQSVPAISWLNLTYILRSACHCSAASLEPCPAYTGALDRRRHMRNIVDEVGEIIAKATDDHTLIGGHHRLAVAASLGHKLFWKDTGEPVRLDPFFRGSHL